MSKVSAECVKEAKLKGFLQNRGTDCFSGRVVSAQGGAYTPCQLRSIADCAERCGGGTVVFTTRLSAEIVGIPYEELDHAQALLKGAGLSFGGTGPRIRPVTACKGTTCVFGCCDTRELAAKIHREFYEGWSGVTLPHKFKIAVGGCPNSCIKPSLNDFGLEAGREKGEVLFQIYVGGMWGRRTRIGDPLPKRVPQREIFTLLDGTLHWYIKNAAKGERLGDAIDRTGFAQLRRALLGD